VSSIPRPLPQNPDDGDREHVAYLQTLITTLTARVAEFERANEQLNAELDEVRQRTSPRDSVTLSAPSPRLSPRMETGSGPLPQLQRDPSTLSLGADADSAKMGRRNWVRKASDATRADQPKQPLAPDPAANKAGAAPTITFARSATMVLSLSLVVCVVRVCVCTCACACVRVMESAVE
jgi:hypothetical protein